jgi:hypothetical protein
MRKRGAWLDLYKRKEMGVGQLVQDKERDLWLNFLERLRHVCYAWGQGREEDEMWKRKKTYFVLETH